MRQQMLIGGEWVAGESGETIDVVSAGHRSTVLAQVPRGGTADADKAVAAARAAFPAWRDMHFKERQRRLLECADALAAAAEDLARLTARDTGNAIRTQARPESQSLVDLFRYFGGVAGEFKGVTLPAGDGQLQYTRREPLGVVAGILPWNSPLLIAGFKTPAALAAGNTMVLKAAEDAPLTILAMAEICAEFLPPGVLNVVTGYGAEVGEALVQHPDVDKVSFTGSTRVGRHVAASAGERLAHASFELGGKSPSIVFPSAAQDAGMIDSLATNLLAATRFARQGQSCTAGSRLFVHSDVYDEVVAAVAAKAKAMVVGDPLDEKTDMGAIINAKQFDQINSYIADGKSQPGVELALDCATAVPEGLDGFFQGPTIFSMADNSWRVAQEEIFGPVLVAIRFSDREQAITMANDSHYGLAAYIWSNDLTEALDTAHRVDAGWVQVNQGGGQVIGQSYGGYKTSGIGREVSLEGAMEGFTQIKQINVKYV